ncbi:MAG: glycosyltransferase family 10 domain-containing protein [Bacteroidota bacterium]
MNDNIFDINNSRDNVLERFAMLKKRLNDQGHCCHTLDQYDHKKVDVLILSRFDSQLRQVLLCIKRNPEIKIILTANEPWIICPFHTPEILGKLPIDIVLTWNENAVTQYTHIRKCNIGQPIIHTDSIPSVEFNKKKMCCLIVSNKKSNEINELYSERLSAVHFFADKNAHFDLYGVGWESSHDPFVKKVYKGTVSSKKETMKHYKFAICYENVKNEKGLITEKIFDCFAAGCVPIYYGSDNVSDYIPKECFIDFRDFTNYQELYTFMMYMGETEYNAYLAAVKQFLKTDEYKEFTSEAYVQNVLQAVNDLSGKKVKRNFCKVKFGLLWLIIKNSKFFLKNLRKSLRLVFNMVAVW